MTHLFGFIHETAGLIPDLQIKLLTSAVIILILWLIRTLVLRIVWRKTEDVRTRYVWRKTLTYTAVTFSIILVGLVWYTGFKSMATFLGLVSAGIAIVLKDPII